MRRCESSVALKRDGSACALQNRDKDHRPTFRKISVKISAKFVKVGPCDDARVDRRDGGGSARTIVVIAIGGESRVRGVRW